MYPTNEVKQIRYGGSVCDKREYNAIMKVVAENIKNGNWQANKEAKLMEAEASKFLGVKHGVLTTSGSAAGLLALSALELPKGSEVIIPAVTFPTIFNIIVQCGLVPVVVDVDTSFNLDLEEVKKAITKKTKAIIAVHVLGNPVDMVSLMKIAKKHKLYVIEDNCDGWGAEFKGKKVGSFGHLSITSFHAAHIVSMGVGGGVFTNDKSLAKKVRMYRDWGRQADINKSVNTKWKTLPSDYNPRFIYEKVGYNFQILELQAAMGRIQLTRTKAIKNARNKNFELLSTALAKKLGGQLLPPAVLKGANPCWFALPLVVTSPVRGKLLRHLEKHGIETRNVNRGRRSKGTFL